MCGFRISREKFDCAKQLFEADMSQGFIMRTLGISRATVKKILKAKQYNIANMKGRSGRRRSTTPREDRSIMRSIQSNTNCSAKAIAEKSGVDIANAVMVRYRINLLKAQMKM
ncbi:hypothetical protein Ciccas_003211 [Cichlidogyrus casuarinus]|uniref:Resolvase HTH domain-containing protein n=1 Tax=Cichlidogyrus casuarinus TaxID=1844966 RepID=A0ABD2QF35_9PLAT